MSDDPTPDQLALGRALEQVTTLLRRLRPASSISATGLSLLDRLERHGAQRITDLAVHEGVSQPAMTALVNRLEGMGLAARSADPSDGRAALVVATPDGSTRLAAFRAERARGLAQRLAHLSPDDQRALLDALPALDRLTGASVPANEKEIVHA